MNKSESIAKLAEALSKAQGEIKNAAKDSKNPHFNSKYADLASVWDVCREPLSKNGLAVIQVPEFQDGRVVVKTLLVHTSGEFIEGELALQPTKSDPQGVGSAITYGRRYGLAAFTGVAPEDDDGNEASGRTPEATTTGTVVKRSFKKETAATEPAAEMATKEQQDWLVLSFRDNLPPEFKKHADQLRREWLALQGYKKEDGAGSSSMIPRNLFKAVAKNAIEYAKTIKEPEHASA